MQRSAMDDGGLHDEEPFVERSRWPARAKDWRQVFLIVAVVVGLVIAYRFATAPPPPSTISPAGERVATKFVQALLVHHDCALAGRYFDYVHSRPDGPPEPFNEGPPPRTNRLCARYVWASGYLDKRQDLWYLVRGSGAIVPNCAFRGRLSVRYGVPPDEHSREDDCVSFRLITRKPLNGWLSGHLDVEAHRSHGRWLVTNFFAQVSEGAPSNNGNGCGPGCLALWKKRVNAPLPESAGRVILTLSKSQGPPGTRVVVRTRNCFKPDATRYALEWTDHYNRLRDSNGQGPPGVTRPIPITGRLRKAQRAIFLVRRSDHRGAGQLEFICRRPYEATAVAFT